MYQFIYQHEDSVNQCAHKNTPGRFVAMGIHIDCKECGIGQQGDAADGCQKR